MNSSDSGPNASPHTLEQSLEALAATIRNASESLLDLQEALARLRVATEPRLASSVHDAVDVCLRNAMRG